MATVAAAGEPESACLSDDGSIVVDADGDDDEDDDSNHATAAEDLPTQRASDAGGSASIDDVSPVFQVRANAMHGRSVTTRRHRVCWCVQRRLAAMNQRTASMGTLEYNVFAEYVCM